MRGKTNGAIHVGNLTTEIVRLDRFLALLRNPAGLRLRFRVIGEKKRFSGRVEGSLGNYHVVNGRGQKLETFFYVAEIEFPD